MSKSNRTRLDAAERIAIFLTLIWGLMCALVFALLPAGEPVPGANGVAGSLMTTLAVVMPVALIWVSALAARHIRQIRDENRHLRFLVDEIQEAHRTGTGNGQADREAPLRKRLDELSHAQKKTEAAIARLNSVTSLTRREAARIGLSGTGTPQQGAAADELAQASLALDAPPRAETPLSKDDLIRALNFPRDETDREGFRALRIAMSDRAAAGLLRSAEDVLTLLAEDSIYVDDLQPDRAHPDIWRKFAEGKRGGIISDLGGVRDRESLAKSAGRMRQDPVFRDCAHHFLRRFDALLSRFVEIATDEDVAALAETRSARAFMLLGRVWGMFD